MLRPPLQIHPRVSLSHRFNFWNRSHVREESRQWKETAFSQHVGISVQDEGGSKTFERMVCPETVALFGVEERRNEFCEDSENRRDSITFCKPIKL
jgi:hypothetical protein